MTDHPDYLASRRAAMLDAEAQAAQERSDQAQAEVRARALTRTGIVGRVGTQQGREVEIGRNREGVIILRDPHRAIHGGILIAVDDEQAGRLVEALAEAVDPDRLNMPAHYGPVGHIDTLGGVILVERIITGTIIRNMAAIHNRGAAIVQTNADQTAALRDVLVRALGQ